MGSMGGGNTPTPHKFNNGANPIITEFDPMSGQKEPAGGLHQRPMHDNYMNA